MLLDGGAVRAPPATDPAHPIGLVVTRVDGREVTTVERGGEELLLLVLADAFELVGRVRGDDGVRFAWPRVQVRLLRHRLLHRRLNGGDCWIFHRAGHRAEWVF